MPEDPRVSEEQQKLRYAMCDPGKKGTLLRGAPPKAVMAEKKNKHTEKEEDADEPNDQSKALLW